MSSYGQKMTAHACDFLNWTSSVAVRARADHQATRLLSTKQLSDPSFQIQGETMKLLLEGKNKKL
jgi:hypothetical protein